MADAVRIEISVEAVDNTSKTVQELIRNLQSIGTAANKTQSGMDKASSSVSKFDTQADKTTKTLQGWMKQKWQLALEAKDRVSPVLSTLKSGLNSLTSRAWGVTMKVFDFVTSPVRGILNLLRNPLFQAGSVLGVSIGLKDTIDTYKGFESAMSQVQAVSGASSSELDKLTEKAKEMGATTKFTAEEAAEAFNYMAMAGWKTADMMGGIEGILNLAAASGEDLATTSDIVTDALTAFNMQAGDAGHFADVLAAASANANTNVSMMGETFKYVGAMAGTLGYSIEDVGLAVGLMANAGIKASMAGTELNSIFTRLSTNSNHARDAIEDIGAQFAELQKQYQLKIEDMNVRVESFQLETLAEAFSEELDGILPQLEGDLTERMSEVINTAMAVKPEVEAWTAADIATWFGLDGLDTAEVLRPFIQGVAQSIPDKIKTETAAQFEAMDLAQAQETLKNVLSTDIAEAVESTDLADAYAGLSTLQALVAAQAAIEFNKPINVDTPVTVTFDYTLTNPTIPTPTFSGAYVRFNGSSIPDQFITDGDMPYQYGNANGGFTHGAELSWIGEDGPEAIIPLSMKRRERGLELYEQVGEILGVAENANGGVYGFHFSPYPSDNKLPTESDWDVSTHSPAPPMTVSAEPIIIEAQTTPSAPASSAPPVSISIQVQPSFVIDGGDRSEDELVEILRRHMGDIADDIGDELAERLTSVFDNMPLKGAT